MEKLDKLKMIKDLGYTYNSITGEIKSPYGKVLNTINDRYKIIRLTGKKCEGNTINIYHHQFAWYCIYNESVECIDHINGDRLDNRICNLRSVTNQQNMWNSIGKGYSKSKNRFQARIKLNNKLINLGNYKTEEEAHNAYLEAKLKYHTF